MINAGKVFVNRRDASDLSEHVHAITICNDDDDDGDWSGEVALWHSVSSLPYETTTRSVYERDYWAAAGRSSASNLELGGVINNTRLNAPSGSNSFMI